MRPRLVSQSLAWELLDALLALSLAGSALYENWEEPDFDDGIHGPRIATTVLMLLVTVPLVWRRKAPTTVFTVAIAAIALEISLIDEDLSSQPPLQHWIALLVLFYSLGAHATRRRAVVAGVLGAVFFASGDVAVFVAGNGGLEEALPSWFMLSAAYGVGFALRGQRVESTVQARRAERLEQEREQSARAAAAEERVRIGRELHDVVAHAISVIVVQSQAAQRVLEGEQPSAREALGSIETTGRQALVEMRRLLGVIRKEDDDALLAPRPGLAHLDELAAHVREAGLPVELRVEGDAKPLPPGVDLSAYRIVQEALTNSLKHAGPASARVVVRYGVDGVELEITDDGRGLADDRVGGHGLVGMRERAAVVGGDVEAGPNGGRGYAVRARLPA
jgi:signal transduction histidine kinase